MMGNRMSMLEEMRLRPDSMTQMVDLKTEGDEMSPDCGNSDVQPQPMVNRRGSQACAAGLDELAAWLTMH
jgi:hypothetical protein